MTAPLILPLFVPMAGCPHRCVFCDQAAITGQGEGLDRDFGAAIRAMLDASTRKSARRVEVAFYGGSFTCLPCAIQGRLLEQAAPFLETGEVQGIRLSTRPDAVDRERLAFLRDRGVTTVELGVQSMSDRVLELSGRGHAAEDSRRAATLVKECGIALGVQLMTGLPGDEPATSLATAGAAASLSPDLVRIYPALVLGGTPLADMWERGLYRPWSLQKTLEVLSVMIPFFNSRCIPVARVGLHLDPPLLESGRLLAGPVHPALGWAARSEAVSRRLLEWLDAEGGGVSEVIVNPRDRSLCLGEGRRSLQALREKAGPGFRITVDSSVPGGWFRGGDAPRNRLTAEGC